jgi:hypothetical protein
MDFACSLLERKYILAWISLSEENGTLLFWYFSPHIKGTKESMFFFYFFVCRRTINYYPYLEFLGISRSWFYNNLFIPSLT